MKRRWTRLLVRIGLGSAAVLLLPIALTLLDPDATWSLLTFVVRTATGSMRPPPIAADQIADANSQNLAETNRKLKVLFQQKFPPGSSEATLKATLLEQGFKPLPSPDKDCLPEGETAPVGVVFSYCPTFDPSKALKYSWAAGLVCSDSIVVRWSTDDGQKVPDITVSYYGTCL